MTVSLVRELIAEGQRGSAGLDELHSVKRFFLLDPHRARSVDQASTSAAPATSSAAERGERRCAVVHVISGTGEPLCCGGSTSAVFGEASAYFGDGGVQGKDVVGDELVGVVGADGVPIDAIGGDGDFWDE